MNIEEIKAYIKKNEADPEVIKYLDSVSDKRVNKALDNVYKTKLPELVQTETDKRMKLQAERDNTLLAEKEFQDTLNGRLDKLEVPSGLGQRFISDLGVSSTEEEIEERFKEIESYQNEIANKAIKAKFTTEQPKTSSLPIDDMKSQVLNNLGV